MEIVRLAAVTLQNVGDHTRTEEKWAGALDAYRRADGLISLLDSPDDRRLLLAREGSILASMPVRHRKRATGIPRWNYST